MRNIFTLLILATIGYGCTTHSVMMMPSGEQGYTIECKKVKSRCFERAAELCPKGYKMVDSQGSSTGSALMGNGLMVHGNRFELMIRCKE